MNTDTFLSVVQYNAVAMIVVAALMYQFLCPAVLQIIHDGYFIGDMDTSFLTLKKCPSIIHFIWGPKIRGLRQI